MQKNNKPLRQWSSRFPANSKDQRKLHFSKKKKKKTRIQKHTHIQQYLNSLGFYFLKKQTKTKPDRGRRARNTSPTNGPHSTRGFRRGMHGLRGGGGLTHDRPSPQQTPHASYSQVPFGTPTHSNFELLATTKKKTKKTKKRNPFDKPRQSRQEVPSPPHTPQRSRPGPLQISHTSYRDVPNHNERFSTHDKIKS